MTSRQLIRMLWCFVVVFIILFIHAFIGEQLSFCFLWAANLVLVMMMMRLGRLVETWQARAQNAEARLAKLRDEGSWI